MDIRLSEILSIVNESNLFVDTPNKLQPFHIYFCLKDFYKDKLTSHDSLKMYIHHLKVEKCMTMLRQRNVCGAAAMLVEVEKLDRKFPDFVQKGMDSLYLAMLSYNDYITNNNPDEALHKLRSSIKNGIIQSKDYPYFCLSIPTQWINVLRVLIRIKKENEVIEELQKLVKFILMGVHEDKDVSKIYDSIGNAEHNLFMSDVFDNIIYNLERSFGYETMRTILAIIISDIIQECSNKKNYNNSLIKVLSMLDDYDKQHYDTFIDKLYQQKGKLIDIPVSLKKLILDDFKSIYQAKSQQSAIVTYSTETILT